MRVNNKGFSLIELVVVIVLIGILASVAMPRMFQSIDKAYVAAVQAFQSNLASSINTWRADYLLKGNGASSWDGFTVDISSSYKTMLPVPTNSADCATIANRLMGDSSVIYYANLTKDIAYWLNPSAATATGTDSGVSSNPMPTYQYAVAYNAYSASTNVSEQGLTGGYCVYYYLKKLNSDITQMLQVQYDYYKPTPVSAKNI